MGLEVFLPGGILGIIGLGCTVFAVILCFTTDAVTDVGTWFSFALAACVVVFTGVALLFWLKHFQQTGLGKRFVLESEVGGEETGEDSLLGQKGETVSELRPLGKVRIGGKKMAARAETGSIPEGIPVSVVKFTGMELVVRAIDPGAGGGSGSE